MVDYSIVTQNLAARVLLSGACGGATALIAHVAGRALKVNLTRYALLSLPLVGSAAYLMLSRRKDLTPSAEVSAGACSSSGPDNSPPSHVRSNRSDDLEELSDPATRSQSLNKMFNEAWNHYDSSLGATRRRQLQQHFANGAHRDDCQHFVLSTLSSIALSSQAVVLVEIGCLDAIPAPERGRLLTALCYEASIALDSRRKDALQSYFRNRSFIDDLRLIHYSELSSIFSSELVSMFSETSSEVLVAFANASQILLQDGGFKGRLIAKLDGCPIESIENAELRSSLLIYKSALRYCPLSSQVIGDLVEFARHHSGPNAEVFNPLFARTDVSVSERRDFINRFIDELGFEKLDDSADKRELLNLIRLKNPACLLKYGTLSDWIRESMNKRLSQEELRGMASLMRFYLVSKGLFQDDDDETLLRRLHQIYTLFYCDVTYDLDIHETLDRKTLLGAIALIRDRSLHVQALPHNTPEGDLALRLMDRANDYWAVIEDENNPLALPWSGTSCGGSAFTFTAALCGYIDAAHSRYRRSSGAYRVRLGAVCDPVLQSRTLLSKEQLCFLGMQVLNSKDPSLLNHPARFVMPLYRELEQQQMDTRDFILFCKLALQYSNLPDMPDWLRSVPSNDHALRDLFVSLKRRS